MIESRGTKSNEVLRVRVHVEDGVLIVDDSVELPRGQTYWATLELLAENSEVDALAEIASLAQPIGPSDLARKFDQYVERIQPDD